MVTRPVIEEEPTFLRQVSYETPTGPPVYHLVCELNVHWDERTHITVVSTEKENKQYDAGERYHLLARRCGRIAEIIANAPSMVDELWEKDQRGGA